MATPLPAGFNGSYTLAGCADPAHCGTFRRVLARCMSGHYCPGGMDRCHHWCSGSSDPALCGDAPTYQKDDGDGLVLSRSEYADGSTQWFVTDSYALEQCRAMPLLQSARSTGFWESSVLRTSDPPGPPTTPIYSTAWVGCVRWAAYGGCHGWSEQNDWGGFHYNVPITVTAGGP